MTWDELVAKITGTPPAHLATATPDGTPHAATVMPGREGEVLWIAMHATSGKARNLRANPKVALMFEGNGAETYLWGDVELFDDLATKQRIWDAGVLPYDMAMFFQSADNPDWLLARVTPTRATVMAQGEDGIGRHTWTR